MRIPHSATMLTIVLLLTTAGVGACHASAIKVGIRPHVSHPSSEDPPFSDGNMSYLLAYEHDDGQTLWQMGMGYTAQGTSTSLVTSAVTPQLHMILKDRTFWGGLGIMKSYVKGDESYWTDFFWQLQVGIHLPLTRNMDLQMGAYYLFDEWGDIGDFSSDEVELGGAVSYSF